MTSSEARTLVSGDTVAWIEGANGCEFAIGVVHYDPKSSTSHFVKWPDGQKTWLHDGPALKCMKVIAKVKTVGGCPR